MSSIDISNLASDVLLIFDRTLNFLQSIGIIQDYSFNHSNVFFSPTAEKYLETFIALLEEIKFEMLRLARGSNLSRLTKRARQCNNHRQHPVVSSSNIAISNNYDSEQDVLYKLQVLQKEPKSAEVDGTNASTALVPGDLISASHFIQGAEMFVTQQMITPHDELGSFITPVSLLNNEYNVPEIINEPATQSSWTAVEEKDEEQEKENVEKPQAGGKDKLQCSVCDKVLSSKTILNFHMATHTGQKPFCCEHCGKLFTTNLNLSAHLTRQHNLNTESANSCKECGKLFVRKSALDTHMKSHLGVKPYACGVCSKAFTQKVTRDTHQLTHSRDYRFSCGECNKQFPTQAKLNYHSKSHREPQFTCHLCDKKFCTRQYLTAHYRTHDVQRPDTTQCRLDTVSKQIVENSTFSCGQCSRSFPSQHALSLHSQKHNPLSARYRYLEKRKMAPRQKHPCGVCGKEFLLKTSLSHHQRQKHSSGLSERQQKPYSCHLCHKSFTLRAKARLHMQIHTQQAQHGCGMCGRLFLRKDSLQRHMLQHSNVRNIVCTICAHASPTAAMHNQHIKKHGLHLMCDHCEKTFISKTALSFHMQAFHEGKFKYQCGVCGKQFLRECHYRSHLLSHSTDRPYKCDSCDKRFKNNKHCREHMKRVHHPTTQVLTAGEQLSANQITATEISANDMAASQIAIHTLLAGDDATYGQTYDQFQACVQLQ